MAGFYFKDEIGEVAQQVSPQEAAPVTGMNDSLSNCLKSATVIAIVEDYLKCAMKHQKFATGEEMLNFAKNLCSQAMDAGDMTASDSEHILTWCNQHRMDDGQAHAKRKLLGHILFEELCEVCDCPNLPQELKDAVELKNQAEQKFSELTSKYGQIIEGYASEFIRLYGKNFDEHFVQKLGF